MVATIKILCFLFALFWACPGICASVTVTDQVGRRVEIPQPVERVVTTFMPATFFAMCAGLKDRLVGVSNRDGSSALFEVLMDPENPPVWVGNRTVGLNLETISSLSPDLIILYGQKDGIRLADRLTSLGFPTIVIMPETLDQMALALDLVGRASGMTDHTGPIVKAMSNIRNKVADRFAGLPRPRIYYASSNLLTTISGDMLQDEMIDLVGGENVSRETHGFFVNISKEQLISWNPDIIFVSDRLSSAEQKRLKGSEFSNIQAVKAGSIYRVPPKSYWDFPSPLVMAGLLWMGSRIHPETLSTEAAQAEITALYDLMFGQGFSKHHPTVVGLP